MNISVNISQKKNRLQAHIKIGKHDDYVYRWHDAMIDLGLVYEYDGMVNPMILRNLEYKEGAIYLKPRWCHEFCLNGGLHKKKYITAQFTTWELQEQIEQGNVLIKYMLGDKPLVQVWDKLPLRNGKPTRDLIKHQKAIVDVNKHGCLKEYTEYRAAGYSPLCCMCNEKERKVLEEG